jgi:ferredoxin
MSSQSSLAENPRTAAKQAVEAYEVQPTGLVSYRSMGNLLILGDAGAVSAVLDALPVTVRPFALLTGTCPPELMKRLSAYGIGYLESCSELAVEGHLGAFRITANCTGIRIDAASLWLAPHTSFDLVLDLQPFPSFSLPVLPIGYSAPGADPVQLAQALERLGDLVGEFDKPKFFEYRPELCAHGASRIEGCRACLEACGAGAIRSAGDRIEVNPHLCQGCGECATVCPSGALNYAYPRRKDSLNRLRRMLEAFFEASGESPELLLHDNAEGAAWIAEHEDELPESVLPFELEALGAAGMDLWLAALACGFARVTLLAVGGLIAPTQRVLAEQIGYAGEILDGMGYSADLIRLVRVEDWRKSFVFNPLTPTLSHREREFTPARFAADEDKRTVIRLAVEHLFQHAPRQPDFVTLSSGAPFGEIRVDKERCTLCLACVSVCPERALADGRDLPQLKFIEANCVQCGLCETACPEHAVTRAPRYLFDAREARQPRLLHEEAVFRCVECGKPFATAAMIETITRRLQHHPMFQGPNLRRLMMCEECRVKAHFGANS